MWIRNDAAFEPIVDFELFREAERVAALYPRLQSDEKLLERLREFLTKKGQLTARLIRDDPDMPCSTVYSNRFGGLTKAYERIGYETGRNYSYVERDRIMPSIRRAFVKQGIEEIVRGGASARLEPQTQLMVVNERLKIRLCISRCRAQKRVSSWKFDFRPVAPPDATLIARLVPDNNAVLDYFYVPWGVIPCTQMAVRETIPPALRQCRFMDLSFLKTVVADRRDTEGTRSLRTAPAARNLIASTGTRKQKAAKR